ncbi:hypothetical protein PAHAL_9G506100 [Panicum hallii]|uniref:Uncharacterized protein n=1 Tax=Panicum hallii TaxID=206008 RepID=A0A2T8I5A5_9POAL|nr:hypothetical protein PAHAL_9G506100 [Panicum hallii]
MDGQDGGQRKKPHGNPNPRRGSILIGIVKEIAGRSARNRHGSGSDTATTATAATTTATEGADWSASCAGG